jgi:hypothetical protein
MMTHDPLCEWAECVCPLDYDVPERGHLVHCPDQYCECEFIAKVREDTLRRPSEDGWMSVRAVLDWEDQVRADEQQQVARRLTAHHAKGCIGGKSGLGCGCGLWADIMTSSVEQP